MSNMKALSLMVRKLRPRLKFLFTHPTLTRTPKPTRTPYDVSSPDIHPGSLKRANCIEFYYANALSNQQK